MENDNSKITKEMIQYIIELIKKNPNDGDLGREVRKIYNLFIG